FYDVVSLTSQQSTTFPCTTLFRSARMKKKMKKLVLSVIQIRPDRIGGPISQPKGAIQPPKNSTGISMEIRNMPMYSPTKNRPNLDRKSTRLNSSHVKSSYAVFCLN